MDKKDNSMDEENKESGGSFVDLLVGLLKFIIYMIHMCAHIIVGLAIFTFFIYKYDLSAVIYSVDTANDFPFVEIRKINQKDKDLMGQVENLKNQKEVLSDSERKKKRKIEELKNEIEKLKNDLEEKENHFNKQRELNQKDKEHDQAERGFLIQEKKDYKKKIGSLKDEIESLKTTIKNIKSLNP